MPYIKGQETEPNKSLYFNISKDEDEETVLRAKTNKLAVRYYEKLSEYNKYNARALGALKSIISKDNIERFKDKDSASGLYNLIVDTFRESSLDTIGRYYNNLIDANYSNYKLIDEYTSNI